MIRGFLTIWAYEQPTKLGNYIIHYPRSQLQFVRQNKKGFTHQEKTAYKKQGETRSFTQMATAKLSNISLLF